MAEKPIIRSIHVDAEYVRSEPDRASDQSCSAADVTSRLFIGSSLASRAIAASGPGLWKKDCSFPVPWHGWIVERLELPHAGKFHHDAVLEPEGIGGVK